MLDMCELSEDSDGPRAGKHRELERAKIQKSEDAVQRTILVIQNFTNPFTIPDKNHLCNIASGAPSPPDVEYDVLHAEKIGKEANRALFVSDLLQLGLKLNFCSQSKNKH